MPVAKTKSGKKSETPLMKQYYRIKQEHPDAILLFRVGDFYETFGEDAIATSKVLGIVLTQRKNGAASAVELAGFPHHALDSYLPKLVRAGYRVAICDQLEDPRAAKTVVKRGVTELVTPGVSYNEQVLEHRSNNFLCAVHFGKKKVGVAFVDVSTGEFLVAEGAPDYADKLVQGFGPSEVLYQRNHEDSLERALGKGFHTYRLEDWVFSPDFALDKLTDHFGTTSLKGFGVEDLQEGIVAAGAVIHYLNDTHHDKLEHIGRLQRINEGQHVWLDRFTVRNLELINAQQPDGRSLLQVMDKTVSPMGARLLKRWLVLPLKSPDQIKERHEVVDFFMNNEDTALAIREAIDKMGDLERLISRVSVGKANPREVLQLGKSAKAFAPIRKFCEEADNPVLNRMAEQINLCQPMLERIENEIREEAPALVSKGGVICDGVDPELDEAREMAHSGKDYLIGLQKREGEATGISSLKVAYNNVFGYYLEVRNTHKDKVPEEWVRKQTLVNAERYITQELKEYESKILGAQEKILQLEEKLFRRLVEFLVEYIEPVQYTALVLAKLDCLLSFAQSASQNGYTRPTIDESDVMDIQDGRHPVIESELPLGEAYIPNDVYLDNQTQQVLMITGPNMSGKSALLRQTALIALMAQMGSFVPAKRARVGIVDKVFSRVGASDNISSGESTFMVEMNETASILNNLTPRSLVLLDEIGRGTSTYDGISIAWAITEYIHENQHARAKTLFATHYHELNAMADQFERIKNFSVSVREYENKVIFLRKLVQGGSEHSFGIHVARMAGMPSLVIRRAGQILEHLEQTHAPSEKGEEKKIPPAGKDVQMSFFQLDDPVLEQIRDEIANLDINSLTPVEALMKLNEIKKISTGSD